MRCDELKAYNVVVTDECADYICGQEQLSFEAYAAEDVDSAIAELKDENRKLKRALWLARAERAKTTQLLLKNAINHLESKYKHRFDNMRLQFHVWGVVKRKCLKKAKEYK